MADVKHVVWTDLVTSETGRAAITIEGDYISLNGIEGGNAPADVLFTIFADNPDLLRAGNALAFARKEPVSVQIRFLDGGGREIMLRVLKSAELQHAPVEATVVFRHRRISDFSEMNLGDLVLLLADASKRGEFGGPTIRASVANIFSPLRWDVVNEQTLFIHEGGYVTHQQFI